MGESAATKERRAAASESKLLSFDVLRDSIAGNVAAIRLVTRLEPIGGPGDKVFPPTYGARDGKDGACYSFEPRRIDGQEVTCYLLDSVQSQANRLEQALEEAIAEERVTIPRLVIDFADTPHADMGRLSSLQAPHRIADAYFRDAELDGVSFRESEPGRAFENASIRKATGVFNLCPCSLLFGLWNSTGLVKVRPEAKFHRCITSEIVAVDATPGERSSSRVDPYFTGKGVSVWTENSGMPTFDADQAENQKAAKRPSEINLGNILPTVSPLGGVTSRYALQTTVLSLCALRQLRFSEDGKASKERDDAARTVLAAIGLLAVELQREAGYWLRSRCQLYPCETPSYELIGKAGAFSLGSEQAIKNLEQAVKLAAEHDLAWERDEWRLAPGKRLLDWATKAKAAMGGGEDNGK